MGKYREEEILEQAVIETEKEVFGDAFGKEEMTLDESGDTSLEEMGDGLEGQHESEAEDEEDETSESDEEGKEGEGEEEAQAETTTEAKDKPPAKEGRVPAGRLREQTERLRTVEAERDDLKRKFEESQVTSRKEIDAVNQRLNDLMAAIQRPQPQQQAPETKPTVEEPPDIFEDPKGYQEFVQRQFRAELAQRDQAFETMRVENSLQIASAQHGETFTAAFEAVRKLNPQSPEDVAIVRRIYASPNPGEALVQWHKRNEVIRQVGDDPSKYRDQIAAQTRESLMKDPEFRRQLLDELKAEAGVGDAGKPRTITNIPRSLSQTSGSMRGDYDRAAQDGSDRAVFDSVFRP